jgi:hypothetical protein
MGLFLHHTPHEVITSQNSVLLHDLRRTVCEPHLSCMAASTVVLLKFVLMLQVCPFASKSNNLFSCKCLWSSAISIKFSRNTLLVYVRVLYRIEPVARKLFTFWKTVFVLRSAHRKMFVLIYEFVAGRVGI